ncbi:chemotaxis protein CheA, partial [Cohnella xylanilytica]
PSIEELGEPERRHGFVIMLLITPEPEEKVAARMAGLSQLDGIEVTAVRMDDLQPEGGLPGTGGGAPGVRGAEPAGPAASKPGGESRRTGATVRVDVERLEKLLNLVGELLIDNTRLQDVRRRLGEKYADEPEADELSEIGHHIGKVIGELQDGMMKTRMLPIEQLFNRFPRMMRDMAQQLGKEIALVLEGKETELDRTLIEEITDPIIHILRNSADHAIETPEERERLGKPRCGTVVLKASHEDNQIVISVSDDGRGIDPARIREASVRKGMATQAEADRMSDREAVRLIFHSGVSTAASVTDLSGRGVGMDIVRAHIERLNGLIDIDTEVGKGTTFTIKLPLTLAIIRALLVGVGDSTFALPLGNVVEIVRLEPDQIQTVRGREVCLIRGTVFPLARLGRKLGISGGDRERKPGERLLVVMIGVADRRVCLAVDRTIGNQEIVIKSLGAYVGQVPYMAGATLLGDGTIALILDVAALSREDGLGLAQEGTAGTEARAETETGEQYVSFRMDSEIYAMRTDRVKEIIPVPPISPISSAASGVAGMIRLRGRTVPVLDLSRALNLPPRKPLPSSRLIVVESDDREVGVWTDEIGEVFKARKDEIEPASDVLPSTGGERIEGICHRAGRMVVVLGIDAYLREMLRATY